MNSELTFRVASLTLWILLASIRIYYSIRERYARKAQPSGEKTSTRERLGMSGVVLSAVILSFLAVFFLYVIYPPWMAWFTLPLPTWLRWIGVGLGIACLPLLLWVHHTLGKYWSRSLELKEQHRLVTSGPYRWVRHPMYSALFGFMIAISLVSANWLIVLLSVAAIIGIYAIVGREEAMMIEQFGDEYRDYMNRTGRLLPRLTRKED